MQICYITKQAAQSCYYLCSTLHMNKAEENIKAEKKYFSHVLHNVAEIIVSAHYRYRRLYSKKTTVKMVTEGSEC